MALDQDQRCALLVAILATYNYSLDRAWSLREALQANALCDPPTMAQRTPQDIGQRLKAAGYDRGGITYIIAERVAALMRALNDGQLDALPLHIAANARQESQELLLQVKGVGPKCAELAWQLLKPLPAA